MQATVGPSSPANAVLVGTIWSDTTCPDGANTDTNGHGNCDGEHRVP